jgi:hypothetical protein
VEGGNSRDVGARSMSSDVTPMLHQLELDLNQARIMPNQSQLMWAQERRQRIRALRLSHFTYEGVMTQIGLFMAHDADSYAVGLDQSADGAEVGAGSGVCNDRVDGLCEPLAVNIDESKMNLSSDLRCTAHPACPLTADGTCQWKRPQCDPSIVPAPQMAPPEAAATTTTKKRRKRKRVAPTAGDNSLAGIRAELMLPMTHGTHQSTPRPSSHPKRVLYFLAHALDTNSGVGSVVASYHLGASLARRQNLRLLRTEWPAGGVSGLQV